jgi:hypothetical protein
MMPNTSLADLKTTARMTARCWERGKSPRAAEWIRYFDDNIRPGSPRSLRIPGEANGQGAAHGDRNAPDRSTA